VNTAGHRRKQMGFFSHGLNGFNGWRAPRVFYCAPSVKSVQSVAEKSLLVAAMPRCETLY
jgi:hypothetical protein